MEKIYIDQFVRGLYMDISNMKNIVILKNLPSNLVDEAIVILRQNKKIKKPEIVDNKSKKFASSKELNQDKKDNFFVKEAENVISDYISKIENQDLKGSKTINNLKEKYKKLKILSIFLTCTTTLFLILNFF